MASAFVAKSPVVIGVIEQAVADYRIVRADKRVGREWSDAEGVHDFRLSGVCNVDDVKTALPTAEFLVAIDVIADRPGAVQAFGEGQRGEGEWIVGVLQIEDDEGRPGVRTCAISRIAVGSEISTMCTMPRKSPISAILP